jgi:hypothetical protein
LLHISDRLRRVNDRVVVTRIVVGRRVVPVPRPRIGETDPHTDECRALVMVAVVAVAVEVGMALADMPAVDPAAGDVAAVDLAAADMPAAAFARKRGVADDYCEREKNCYGRRTHGFRLHPPVRKGVTGCCIGPLFHLLA